MKTTRIISFLALILFSSMPSMAQSIKWAAKSVKAENGFKIEITAVIPESYHMYDMGPYSDEGPIAAEIQVIPSGKAALKGKLIAPASRKIDDELYGMKVGVYEGKVRFVQEVTGKKGAKVTVKTRAQACSGETCLPPREETITVTLQ